ncbi:probable tRNA methyltransferase 9B [Neoarius graeffei]|uniref:probable tRNA methyltransferase 9B n=1 Tax=Neoarius graeffei TaxID=443677 RepID=UPI00298D1E52|nr:probable tRNA methyltransferase 9B [Neoarius graeffei]XP_060754171.1 probable tRNA methyltransferase 9B [Neoarius graeffei]XP_060754172.1 probable tRNA methyltransferase 9B [Neoarius graeffei]XP_060754173.1 probable tRNA methyltransferase 9B [Neoarius graeffei]XP_060754174.1 probable tRNA methyltransferase 9B [Neoarius graeffei]
MDEAASQLERDHVHSVYERIAPFFNDSRYKAWPRVKQFLLEQEPGSIVADVGCGNGKYLHINESIFKMGCDVCRPLVDSAWSQGHEVQLCDGLRLPYRDGCFDAMLSIAVIHHISTKERRIRALKEMARTLRVGGRVMIYVWAMEQKRRKFEKQDIFVPWNPNPPLSSASRGHLRPRQRGSGSQSVSDTPESDDMHRNSRSTSSKADEEDPGSPAQQRKQKLWFFSRSLDSVLDLSSLTVSRSSSRELSAFCSPTDEPEARTPVRSTRGQALIRQVSSFFTNPSSRNSLEEDVFVSEPHEQMQKPECSNGNEEVSVALVQDCSSVPLPDLVPRQGSECLGEDDGGDIGQESAVSLQQQEEWSKDKLNKSCLRYYHVFREGELMQLIEEHVKELHILQTYLDHANWCVVAEKVHVWRI